MAKKYDDWTRDELLKEVKQLVKRKKYGLVWDYKEEEVVEQCKTKLPVLEEDAKKKIVNKQSRLNHIFIEGDNFHSLSVLNYTHSRKIDLIYIDPPYNTGNKDFVFNDHYVDKEDSYRHSKWLNFMANRLRLAKNLLKEEGAIAISIDDNEFSQLKILCDEIFGENNFVTSIVVKSNPRGSQASKHIANVHEYLLVFAKNINRLSILGFSKSEKNLAEYVYEDENGRKYRLLGLRQRGGEWRREQRPNMYYPFYVNPKDGTVSLEKTDSNTIASYPKRPMGEEGRWTWSKTKALANINLLQGKKVNRQGSKDFYDVFRINYLTDEEGNEAKAKPKSIWDEKELNYQNGRNEIKQTLGDDLFDYPKPTFLIKKVAEMFGNKDALILDFFAGSGTTGQAVLDLNKADGGNRQFILCTNNESNNGRGFKIATDICYPRINRVLEGLKNSGSLRYYKTEFIDKVKTDKDKRDFVKHATEMLCLAEFTFEEISFNEGLYSLFENDNQVTGIIYDEDYIQEFNKAANGQSKPLVIYVFSYDNTYDEDDFKDTKGVVKVKPIPSSILNVYEKIERESSRRINL